MATDTGVSGTPPTQGPGHTSPPAKWIIIGVAALLLSAYAGFLLGVHRTEEVVLVGTAQVGYNQVTFDVGGVEFYGTHGPIEWVDANGGIHDGSWPACLTVGGTPPKTVGTVPNVKFAAITVPGPVGTRTPLVVYVDCRN